MSLNKIWEYLGDNIIDISFLLGVCFVAYSMFTLHVEGYRESFLVVLGMAGVFMATVGVMALEIQKKRNR